MTKIAQIGCGHWGKNLTRNFSEIGALGAIVDGDPATAADMASRYKVPARNLDEVLADDNISGIALATPAETHAALGIRAIEAGKHVYVEKPLALTVDDAIELVQIAEKHNRVLMVGHLLQYHPVFTALLSHVQSGLIGEVQYVYSNRMSLGKFRAEENVLWSFAPHDVSMILALVGEEPVHVTAQGSAILTDGIADWCTVQLTFPGNVRGHIQTSWLHPFKEQRLVVIGSSGMLVFDDGNPKWEEKLVHYPHSINISGPVPIPNKADVKFLEVAKGEPLKTECQHFVDCIEQQKHPKTDGKEGLAVLKVLSAAETALKKSLEKK